MTDKAMPKPKAKQPALHEWEVAAKEGKTYIFTLQQHPLVRVRVKAVKFGKRGFCLEVTGADASLILHPCVSNQVVIDSDTVS